jgi:hypothetical protein
MTPIHVTKKLEKTIREVVRTGLPEGVAGLLGKWNAALFYVDRKKCWLVTNARTKYSVILPGISSATLPTIDKLFRFALCDQLLYDGFKTSLDEVGLLIGDLIFLPTDNDRKTTAFQNRRLFELEYDKYRYGSLEEMPLNKLTNYMNTCPTRIAKGHSMNSYTRAIDEMEKILKIASK